MKEIKKGENSIMGYIYKITNDINNKVYIGQTTNSLEERFQQHKKDALRQRCEIRPLYRAMNKYGFDHFKIEMIEECPDQELQAKEIYWTAYYKGYEDGYNGTRGGDGRALYDHEAIRDKLKKHPYPIDIAKEFNCCPDIVYQIAKTYSIPIKNKGQEEFKLEKSKQVYQYSKDNQFIQSFSSTVEAAKWLFNNHKCAALTNGVRAHISENANGKRKSAYGYIWKYQ